MRNLTIAVDPTRRNTQALSFANVLHSQNCEPQPESCESPIVFVVDAEASERVSLELLISCNGWHSELFSSVEEFLRHPSALVPNCLILEVCEGRNSLELQKRLAVERPEMPLILITPNSDLRMAVEAIKAGAIEFLTKPFLHDLLLTAIKQALERSRVALARQAEMHELRGRYASLSRRERQVMALVVAGLLNKQVGGELGISEITVKRHRRQAMEKMKANSLAQLVKMNVTLRLPAPKFCATASSNCLGAQALA